MFQQKIGFLEVPFVSFLASPRECGRSFFPEPHHGQLSEARLTTIASPDQSHQGLFWVASQVNVSWILMSCVSLHQFRTPHYWTQLVGCLQIAEIFVFVSKISSPGCNDCHRWMYFVWRSNQCWTGLRFYGAAVLYLPLVRHDPGQAIWPATGCEMDANGWKCRRVGHKAKIMITDDNLTILELQILAMYSYDIVWHYLNLMVV